MASNSNVRNTSNLPYTLNPPTAPTFSGIETGDLSDNAPAPILNTYQFPSSNAENSLTPYPNSDYNSRNPDPYSNPGPYHNDNY